MPRLPSLLSPSTAIIIIAVWMVIVAILMGCSGLAAGSFFSFGPNETVVFFGNPINTISRYFMVVIYLIINQTVQTYGLETISPWMITVVQNRSNPARIENPARTQLIIAVWYVYLWSGRIFGIQVMLSQIDFLLIVLAVDVTATAIVTNKYIKEKNKNRIDNTDESVLIMPSDSVFGAV